MTPPLIIFDLDGTLAESKQVLAPNMADLLSQLLAVTKVAIVSGGALEQFLKQVVDHLPKETNLANLYLLPTSGAALYEFQNNDWHKIYEERLSEYEANIIEAAMRASGEETGVINFNDASWGERIEYRGGQVTLSALGQQAPIALKKTWDPDHEKRYALQENLAARLPEFLVAIGGITSIDVTKRGIDKAYGVRQLCQLLKLQEQEALYVGDELESGGNDGAVYKTDVQTKSITNPAETEKLIESFLSGKA